VAFINNALLVMVMSANFEDAPKFFPIFHGKYSDFNLDWFIDIGAIVVSSMTVTAIYPLIELAIFGGILYLKRARDQKTFFIERIPFKTQKQTITQYFDLYAGPAYQIHYKYSYINNICFVAFMYGPGIPVLFPIGLLGLINLYIAERWSVAKYYQMPPNISEKLNEACIRDILWSPIFYYGIGFWMFSNRQIFENVVEPIDFSNSVVRYGHTFKSIFERIYPGDPLIIFMIVHLIACLASNTSIQKKLYNPETLQLLKTNNNKHGNYYSSLSLADKMWFQAEEEFLRKRYGIERIAQARIDKMMKTPPGDKTMTRVPFYDMLANQKYRFMF